ncbi:GNAT family N-acetyltransferase [Aquincola tertiaricarbonis]|uniref:GNAT family N-acetyltransferase n=1 Tax=Aquincola tertiaricarbonis TaxID=391953 RepID=UPI000695CC70|nr:GNAT family N-acetyltransferase [Aquincola tertiaricarbonis]
MTDQEFSTERCIVRRWREADLPALLAVYGDADAMQWVGAGQPITLDQCVQWLAVTQHNYTRYGYGMFAVELKGSLEVVGFCGLVRPGGQAQPELKYAYHRVHWGQGLATEVAAGLLQHAARRLGLQHVMATAAPENHRSHQVLLKAGMVRGALVNNLDETSTLVFEWRAVG